MFLVIRLVLRVLTLALVAWLLASAALFAVMLLPPEKFAAVVGKAPAGLIGRILPFAPLWKVARKGSVDAGDPAPEFDLERLDKTGRVKLTSHMGDRPVVLVFGSYT
jgi:hypothetical protein